MVLVKVLAEKKSNQFSLKVECHHCLKFCSVQKFNLFHSVFVNRPASSSLSLICFLLYLLSSALSLMTTSQQHQKHYLFYFLHLRFYFCSRAIFVVYYICYYYYYYYIIRKKIMRDISFTFDFLLHGNIINEPTSIFSQTGFYISKIVILVDYRSKLMQPKAILIKFNAT